MPNAHSPERGHMLEPLLRRFLPEGGDPAVIPAAAFRPNANDTTGISVSLQSLPHPIQRVLADTRKPASSYSVCVFSLHELDELTVELSPTPSDPGHATIPQICPPYEELKKSDERRIRIKNWTVALMRRSRTIHRAGDTLEPA